jgi:hypothetical protein
VSGNEIGNDFEINNAHFTLKTGEKGPEKGSTSIL